MLGSYSSLLRNRNFMFLWLGQVISQFGDRLTQIALIGLVYTKIGADSLGLAKILFFTILPVFLINPLAGVYIDRWDKRKTMYAADFLRGVLILVLGAFLIGIKSFIPIYVVIFLAFCVGRFFVPAKMSILPMLVKKDEIITANSLVSITANVAAILGFGVGGIIVESWGAKGGFIFDSMTFFSSSLLIMFITIKIRGRFDRHDLVELGKGVVDVERSLIREFKEGIKYILSRQSTLFSVKIFSVLFSCLGALYVVFIVFVQQTLHTATKDLGFLAVWLGLGLFIGSLVYGRVAHKFSLVKSISLMLFLTCFFLTAFVLIIKNIPSPVLACFFSFILGVLVSPIVVGCNSLIHKKSGDEFWGRIFSSLEVVMHFSFVVCMFLAAALAEIFSPFKIILVIGIIISVFSLGALLKGEKCLS